MTAQLHYFNPGHETAILLGSENYTPPANVRRITTELAYLPVWYADQDDYVLTDETTAPRFFALQPKELKPFASVISQKELKLSSTGKLPALHAAPWGLSPHSIHLFEGLNKKYDLNLTIPIWDEQFFRLTGRQTAADCLERMQALLPDISLPATPKFCTQIREIEKYLILRNAPFLIKTPYSSSGRGLLWLPERKLSNKERVWIEGALKKQGSVSIECALNKKQDFALEFHSDGQGNVRYEGLSVFSADSGGAYTGNRLGNQKYLYDFVIKYIGKQYFDRIIEAARQTLQTVYGTVYNGYMGIDMLIYEDQDGNYAIHPCIEINMRYTMGMVAVRISQKYLAESARGDFQITFENHPGDAYEKHCFMKKAYPLEFENGKIKEGYLALCPVTKETKCRAYILVF